MPLPGRRPSSAASPGSTSRGSAPIASALRAGSRPTNCTPATPSTRRGPRSSGPRSKNPGCRWLLDGDPFEGFGVAVAGLLPDLPAPLAHELLEVPLATGLGDLALVLLQSFDLQVERGRDVDHVIARGPERDPHLFHDVRLVSLLEEASESARVA